MHRLYSTIALEVVGCVSVNYLLMQLVRLLDHAGTLG